jgi:hypothetical protein
MLDPKLTEEIDACRPGSRDIQEPELARLAELISGERPTGERATGERATDDEIADRAAVRAAYDAVQQIDARLVAMFDSVPVPGGLAGRLLDRLAANPAAGLPSTEPLPERSSLTTTTTKVPSSLDAERMRPVTRRDWIKFCGWTAAGLLVAISAALVSRPPATSRLDIADEAAVWFRQLAGTWRPVARPPKGFPIPAGIGGTPIGWQPLAGSVAKKGVAYDLTQGRNTHAVLFVLGTSRRDLPIAPPHVPQSTTAGLAIGAWQSGGLLYVLVVQGDERAYRKFFSQSRPLA